MTPELPARPIYTRIIDVVRQIPRGKVCTYGGIAQLTGGCTARMVGYAMSSLPENSDVPWQRVINAKGKISPHGAGFGSHMQKVLLEEEGVDFSPDDVIDFERFGWPG